MEKIINNKKLFTALIVLAIVAVVFVLLLFTVETRVIGTWQRETMYLEKYGCETVMILELYKNGSFETALCEEGTGKVLNRESGNWKIVGFEIECRRPGQDGCTPYDFNPITGTLKNNVHYRKIG